MTATALAVTGLRDAHGRTARDLRVSLTDRCNLRCSYCMPAEGLPWLPTADVLTDDEVVHLVSVAVRLLGVRKVRFTGGEPLLRRGLAGIVASTARLRTDEGLPPEISLTTNGVGLERRIHELAESGLNRVNVSLDTLDRERYAALARRDRLPDVLRGLAGVEAAGLRPVKVNTVVMRGVNEADVVPLAEFCLARGYRLRFIEQMPLGPEHGWDRSSMVPAAEILEVLGRHFKLTLAEQRGSAPAQEWLVAASERHRAGRIGVIASVTAPFCAACDRTRLTADGHLRTCLFAHTETDLRTPLREGATDHELAALWQAAHLGKAAGHGIGTPGFHQPARTMSAIGG
ncbi:MAG: GTP 3',8-cyclase MoaA [Actinobacteria bacterium HGW-Actinobacteria-5]|jgi:cyclic pyranopterin phosphate synthase|nr:MAG: GTP 3',8-cyclase MoaA [Actinobacteria bacterium HGW-Actinobacteria-5]